MLTATRIGAEPSTISQLLGYVAVISAIVVLALVWPRGGDR